MKNYILDTTVVLYDAQAIFKFDDNNVIIPIPVIEDVDHFKKDLSEIGRSARQLSRYLDILREQASVTEGIKLDNGGMLFVRLSAGSTMNRLPDELRERRRDNLILAIALEIKQNSKVPTIFVSKDINLRIKANALGLTVEDYESDKVDINELYQGYTEITLSETEFTRFRESSFCPYADSTIFPNEFVVMHNEADPSQVLFGRYGKQQKGFVRLISEDHVGAWRITPKNREQIFAMDALLNENIQLVTLVGKAGTGKTLLAIAASLYLTVDRNAYSRVLVSRPTMPMGKDIGFLPGGIEEKLTPWMYPIVDNVEFLMRRENRSSRHVRGFRELVDMGILVIEPLTYIRGRSIHSQFVIIDEAQNLTPHEIKTIITRVGEGTKIVVTGDPYQIDNPYIDSSSNGLTYLVEKFKDQEISAHITLTKGERSTLSEIAANIL